MRAWPGGHGAYKLGANYGPTILPAHQWEQKGYSQLLGVGPKGIIMEGGAMNIFFLWINEQGEKELITCPLNGLILPGITRKSHSAAHAQVERVQGVGEGVHDL